MSTGFANGKNDALKAPFPYCGGKSKVAAEVWQRLGNTPNYIEPFAGSLAVLLARPTPPKTETVNDYDGHITNVWRSIQLHPEAVAHHADWPVSELCLHARHTWLNNWGRQNIEKMRADPDFCDPKAAGYWLFGKCCWIGNGWCCGAESLQIPHLGDSGRGLNRPEPRKRPQLGSGGRGIHGHRGEKQQTPHMGNAGMGINRPGVGKEGIYDWMLALSARLRNVRICCGDWSRICGPTPTTHNGLTGVFLDPPYSLEERDETCYSTDTNPAPAVRAWCLERGNDSKIRICLAGYAGEGHEELEQAGWSVYRWKARGGYGNQGEGRGKENRRRETLWFSPNCLPPANLTLFGDNQ